MEFLVTRFSESFQIHYLSSLAAAYAFFIARLFQTISYSFEYDCRVGALSVWCMKKMQIMIVFSYRNI